ncbi:MAG: lipoyl(octanoyl) transferase LipB [Gammaproteobacteria bacterium]|nr:lipoyl(octanoyl) transferase LipB [Gammaproteobacteria bacterium]
MLKVRDLGTTDYRETWQRMQSFTAARDHATPDELWLTEHLPVFTLGQTANHSHFLLDTTIPIVESDRGGQVTYHGPGQIVGYALVDLKRAKISVHDFVCLLEQSMIDTLDSFGVVAERMPGNPGVYTAGRKIGALGLRVRRSCTYHGISLNVAMDLKPFNVIEPCGIPGMTVTQLSDLVPNVVFDDAKLIFEETFKTLCSARVTALGAT